MTTQPYQDFNPSQRDFTAPAPIIPRFLAWINPPVYTYGVDLSHWNPTVDFKALYAAGYRFAILKASEGVDWFDSTFSERWQRALDAGFILGAYHFGRSNRGGINQAEHFLETTRPMREQTEGCYVPLMGDWETGDGVTVATRQTNVNKFYESLALEIPSKLSLCYSSPYLWQNLMENMRLHCAGCVAHWTGAAAPLWPNGWWPLEMRLFWQIGIAGKHAWVPPAPGVTGEADVIRFFGDEQALKSYVGIKSLTDHEILMHLWAEHLENENAGLRAN